MIRTRYGMGMPALLVVLAIGCGSDDDSSGNTGGGAGTAGSGGKSGSSGSGGSSGTGGSSSGTGGSSSGTGGSSSGTGGGSSGGCNPTMMMSDCPAAATCIQTNCGSALEECFGANYEAGDYTGAACEEFLGCVVDCDCDETCAGSCPGQEACAECLAGPYLTCGLANCSDEVDACNM